MDGLAAVELNVRLDTLAKRVVDAHLSRGEAKGSKGSKERHAPSWRLSGALGAGGGVEKRARAASGTAHTLAPNRFHAHRPPHLQFAPSEHPRFISVGRHESSPTGGARQAVHHLK